jgi:hypothetical protein
MLGRHDPNKICGTVYALLFNFFPIIKNDIGS